jgi:hypothetical protein
VFTLGTTKCAKHTKWNMNEALKSDREQDTARGLMSPTSGSGSRGCSPYLFDRTRLAWRPWILAFYAILYAIAMLVLGGATFDHLYAQSPYHRLQADALLRGDLHIGDSLQQMRHDLAWQNGEVNHVWGLGIGLWLVPFELLWRLAGYEWFPDRIALGVAFALFAWYSGSTAWKIGVVSRRPTFALGFFWLIVLCPAVWTLNQTGGVVYEETSLYACIVSLAILVATVRVACFGERRDFWICAVLAAFSALVRPTHGIYGLSGMLVCSAVLCLRHGQLKAVILGNVVFVAGLIFLAITNLSRFGSTTEFGHRLTATPGIIVYMTRIDNPMKEATLVQAARELFGTLFLSKHTKGLRSGEKAVPGQAPYERWRDPYVTTFDVIWAAVCAAGLLGAITWLLSTPLRNSRSTHVIARPTSSLVAGLLLWGGLSCLALGAFYLRLPTFSYRYLLDFAPAFTALAMLTWFWIARASAWIALSALGAWLGYEIVSSRIISGSTLLRSRDTAVTALAPSEGSSISEFEGCYASPDDPQRTGISYNGYGWRAENGRVASPSVILALDRPEFVEILVGRRVADKGSSGRQDVYRAMIDNQFLPLREIRAEGDLLNVRFDVPAMIRARNGDELLFLCFTSGWDKPDRDSERALHSVRWR